MQESHGNASVIAYEDAPAELSSTRTPVLPSRSRATPLRPSANARKTAQAQSNESALTGDKTPSNQGISLNKWSNEAAINREAMGQSEASYTARSDGAVMATVVAAHTSSTLITPTTSHGS